MTATLSSSPPAASGLAIFAKIVVALTFVLILIGGHTTTSNAGMAFPDWPLSNGSLNPEGWWTNFMMRLEHGHRLTAGLVATLISVLMVWVWRGRKQLPRGTVPLAAIALLGVLSQAVLGGLRVKLDSNGVATATTFRVLHACVAQIELCVLVALAATLSPAWKKITPSSGQSVIAKMGRVAVAFVFLQLLAGATMRHLGAGLAIPTFPRSTAEGGWMPSVHNAYIDLNFTHTRFGAIVVTLLLLHFATSAMRKSGGDPLIIRPSILLCVLILGQFLIGMFVIWHVRPPLLTTLHVVNGAAVLATTVLLTRRATRATMKCESSTDSVSFAPIHG